jgi:hypothetical protein
MSTEVINSNYSTEDEDYQIEQAVLKELKEREKRKELTKKKIKEDELELYLPKESFYLTPVKKYLKYKRKKAEYKNIYNNEGKLKYHWVVAKEVVWKYFKKKLFKKLLNAAIFSAGMYVFYNSGMKDKLVNFVKFLFSKFKRAENK